PSLRSSPARTAPAKRSETPSPRHAVEFGLLGLSDLTDELAMRLREERFDLLLEILIGAVDFGCNLQLHAGERRDPDRAVRGPFRRNPAEEGEMPAGTATPQQQPFGQAVRYSRDEARFEKLLHRRGRRVDVLDQRDRRRRGNVVDRNEPRSPS